MSTRNFELTPFKKLAHAMVDGLPVDATWQDLAAEVQFEIDLEEAVRIAEEATRKPKPLTDGTDDT